MLMCGDIISSKQCWRWSPSWNSQLSIDQYSYSLEALGEGSPLRSLISMFKQEEAYPEGDLYKVFKRDQDTLETMISNLIRVWVAQVNAHMENLDRSQTSLQHCSESGRAPTTRCAPHHSVMCQVLPAIRTTSDEVGERSGRGVAQREQQVWLGLRE